MYLRDFLASCRRRWLLLLFLVALSAVALNAAAGRVHPTYEAKASVVLVPPVDKELPDQNRYLGLGGLKQSADVLARSMSSDTTVDAIKALAPGARYTIEPDITTSAPILVVTSESTRSDGAARTLAAVLARLPIDLQSLQEAVAIDSSNQITTVQLAADSRPDTVQKTRIRLLGALGAGFLVLTVLLVGVVDGLLLRRKRGRAGRGDAGEDMIVADAGPADPRQVRTSTPRAVAARTDEHRAAQEGAEQGASRAPLLEPSATGPGIEASPVVASTTGHGLAGPQTEHPVPPPALVVRSVMGNGGVRPESSAASARVPSRFRLRKSA